MSVAVGFDPVAVRGPLTRLDHGLRYRAARRLREINTRATWHLSELEDATRHLPEHERGDESQQGLAQVLMDVSRLIEDLETGRNL